MKHTLTEIAFTCFLLPLAYGLALFWLAAFAVFELLTRLDN